MGIKMTEAFHLKSESKITIEQATENSIREDLYCITPTCRINLSYRRESLRQVKDKDSVVKAHFKRKGKKEHTESCRFNTLGQIKVIARDSDGVLESLGKDVYNFRLNFTSSKSVSVSGGFEKNEIDFSNEQPTFNLAKKYENKGKLDPYLSTMHKVMKLRSEIEDNQELSSIIKLIFNGKEINWGNFYFERQDYKKCYNYLKKNKASHPICIEGKIKEIAEPKGKSKYYAIKFTPPWIEKEDKDGVKRVPFVSVKITNNSLLEFIQSEIKKGKRNIALYSNISVNSAFPNGEMRENLFINGSISYKHQLHMF